MTEPRKLVDVSGGLKMLPPAPDVCQTCATKHEVGNAHNQQSLYYQMAFHAGHGRYPTWKDAIAHCVPEVRAIWIAELAKHGIIVE